VRVAADTSRQSGFTMIELLVALLIFSVAIIGYASLNNRLMLSQWSQQQRSHAQQAVQFIAERLKANEAALGCYPALASNIGVAATDQSLDCQAFGTLASQQVAEQDITAWAFLLGGEHEKVDGLGVPILPDVAGCITELEPNRSYRITVVWAAAEGGVAPSHCSPVGTGERGYLSEQALIDFAQLSQ